MSVDAKEESVDDADADQGRAQSFVQPEDLMWVGSRVPHVRAGRERADASGRVRGQECTRTHRLVLDDGHGAVPGAAVEVGATRVQHARLQPDLDVH